MELGVTGEMSELKDFGVKNIREWAWRREEGYSIFALQRNGKGVVPVPPMVVARIGRRCLLSLNTDVAVLKEIVFEEMATKN